MTSSNRLSITLGDAIYSLRAIRRIRPDPIPDDDLKTILDAARQAPNGANRQPWHFIVLRDSEIRTKFGNGTTKGFSNPRTYQTITNLRWALPIG